MNLECGLICPALRKRAVGLTPTSPGNRTGRIALLLKRLLLGGSLMAIGITRFEAVPVSHRQDSSRAALAIAGATAAMTFTLLVMILA
jgi:hypothetical protein